MLLALETSRAQPAFALGVEGAEPQRRMLDTRPGQAPSTHLLPELELTLTQVQHARRPPAWSAIAVSVGPGAFTGLRVGCSVAQGLALASGCRVVAVPTLLAQALACWPEARHPVAVVADARMNERYVAWATPGPVWRLGPVRLLPAADVGVWVRDSAPADVPWLAAGDGWGNWLPANCIQAAPEPTVVDQARAVWELGWQGVHEGRTMDPAELAPLYVRDRVAFTTAERAAGLGGNPQATGWTAP